jgi:hypothetical protein
MPHSELRTQTDYRYFSNLGSCYRCLYVQLATRNVASTASAAPKAI